MLIGLCTTLSLGQFEGMNCRRFAPDLSFMPAKAGFFHLKGEALLFPFGQNIYRKKEFTMKTKLTKLMSVVLAILMIGALMLTLASCKEETDTDTLWAEATHKEDKTLGEGATSFTLVVEAGEKSVTFTVNTDEKIIGEALQKLGIVEGEEGPYGLYVKKVNGILADYNTDGTYWAFYKDGKYMMTGIDVTEIEAGASYELVKEKG